MFFQKIAFSNLRKNTKAYTPFLLSMSLLVAVIMMTQIIVNNPGMNKLPSSQSAIFMFRLGNIILMIFAAIFSFYTNNFLIKQRKKEFGLLMIQGMSPLQLRKMVFIENLVIGLFATLGGILLGLGFSQIILWLSKSMIGISFSSYLPVKAMVVTAVAFILLFFVISFFIQFSLPKLNVRQLLTAGDLGKGNVKASLWQSLAAILLIGGGYGVALWARGATVFMVFIPVVFVVILGTKFLFDQLSVFVIQHLRKSERLFWKKTNMVVFSDLAFRMKDNARSFFLVAVISTVAFAAIGTLYGVEDMLVGTLDRTPYELQMTDASTKEITQVRFFENFIVFFADFIFSDIDLDLAFAILQMSKANLPFAAFCHHTASNCCTQAEFTDFFFGQVIIFRMELMGIHRPFEPFTERIDPFFPQLFHLLPTNQHLIV